jgi:glucose/arabinose dehydrogenase
LAIRIPPVLAGFGASFGADPVDFRHLRQMREATRQRAASRPNDEFYVIGRRVGAEARTGVAVTPDGSLLVRDDGGGSIWRASYKGK